MKSIPIITIKPGCSKPFWAGNPLVYPKAIQDEKNLRVGDWVCIEDAKQVPIGYGFYNPHSLYRVRLIAWANEGEAYRDKNFALEQRIIQAIQLRRTLNLPNEFTNCYRLINSEGDKLSGLTVDVLGDYVVAQVTASFVLQEHALLDQLLTAHFPKHKIIWRLKQQSLQQDGWQGDMNTYASPNMDEPIIVTEHGIQYYIDPQHGQKTGFYCDQRETRWLVQSIAHHKTVLDVCCFNGGFALNAARGGASQVRGIDTSHAAIALAQQNNDLNHCDITFVAQDAIDALHESAPVDLIILDPPKFAPSQKHLANAKRKYVQLNKAAMKALAPGGYLLTCSCSQAMSVQDFTQVLLEAALAAHKNVQLIKTGGAGPDHPEALAATYGHYLKWILVKT